MNIIKIDLPFHDLFVDVTNLDSNEEPESSCVNRLISFKVGEKVFHYFDQDPKLALNKFKSQLRGLLEVSPFELPELGFCVITRFKSEFIIDWDAIERQAQLRQAAGLD